MEKRTYEDGYKEATEALGDQIVVNRFQAQRIVELEREIDELKGQTIINELAVIQPPVAENNSQRL